MPIGEVVHTFISPDGNEELTFAHIGDWSSEEEAPGGQMTASGTIGDDVLAANAHILRRGTVWRTTLKDDPSESRFGGRLLDPAPSGLLSARGWADIERKASRRFMPQTRDVSLWTGMDSPPFSNDRDGYSVADSISAEVKKASIRLKLDGSGQDPESARVQGNDTNRYRNGVIFWAPGVDITRIACKLKLLSDFAPGSFRVGIYKGSGPDGALTLISDGANPYGVSSSAAFPKNIDLRLTADADMLAIILENSTASFQHVNHAASVLISDIRVNGIGYDDDYEAHKFIEEVFGRMGFVSTDVAGNSTNTLPFDLEDNAPYADALDHVNMLTGWRHRITDRNGPHAEWGPWGPEWQVPVDAYDDFVPLERYDAVRMPFSHQGTTDEVLVQSEQFDSAYDVPVIFDAIELDNVPNRNKALDMAHSILEVVSERRMGGEGRLTEVIFPGTGEQVSAHHVQAGDVLWYPHYDDLRVRIATLRREHGAVTFNGDERFAALDRMVARYNRRLHRRGRY